MSRGHEIPSYLGKFCQFDDAMKDATLSGQGIGPVLLQMGITLARSEEEALLRVKEILELLGRINPVSAVGAFHYFDGVMRSDMPASLAFGFDHAIEVLTNATCSPSCASDLTVAVRRPNLTSKEFWRLQDSLRFISNLTYLKMKYDNWALDRADPVTKYQLQLNLEEPFDRLTGYDYFLRVVVQEIFENFDAKDHDLLGFDLTDSLLIVDEYARERQRHQDKVLEVEQKFARFIGDDASAHEFEALAERLVEEALLSAPPVESPSNFEQFLRANGGAGTGNELLKNMSTELGAVPEGDVLSYRGTSKRPIIRDGDLNWFWPRPVDFLQSALAWARDVVSSNDSLRAKFDKSRQVVVENLALECLRECFGGEVVFENVEYLEDGSLCEADGVVLLPALAILVEVKGGIFHEAARRGHVSRLRNYLKTSIDKASAQNKRTQRALETGAPMTDAAGRKLPIESNADIIKLIVTLDRVDPISAMWDNSDDSLEGSGELVINIVDLLAVAHVLTDAEAVVAYLITRAEMLREGVGVFVETDALGAWCENRLGNVETLTTSDGRSASFVSETSELMNSYFTGLALRSRGLKDDELVQFADSVSHGVPDSFIQALGELRGARSSSWLSLTKKVFGLKESFWKKWGNVEIAMNSTAPLTRATSRAVNKFHSGYRINGIKITVDSRAGGGEWAVRLEEVES
ncbi:hypothetical protein [Micrococcus endophyticus]|uniref:hypothetical protein n=1 Tax=Micrococcus endophyticus TaxID=455343 RepID=UPI0034CF8975